jgi:hypothetical protein
MFGPRNSGLDRNPTYVSNIGDRFHLHGLQELSWSCILSDWAFGAIQWGVSTATEPLCDAPGHHLQSRQLLEGSHETRPLSPTETKG